MGRRVEIFLLINELGYGDHPVLVERLHVRLTGLPIQPYNTVEAFSVKMWSPNRKLASGMVTMDFSKARKTVC